MNGGDTWSDESIDGFSDMILEKEIKVKVCNYESCSLSLCQLTLNDKVSKNKEIKHVELRNVTKQMVIEGRA